MNANENSNYGNRNAGFSPRLERLIVELLVIVGIFVKEDSVALAANRGAEVARWIRLLRFKEEPILDGRPFNGRTRLDEIPSEVLGLVDHYGPVDLATPLDIERHHRGHRSDGWYPQSGKSLAVSQGVCKIVCVWNRETIGTHRSPCRIESDLDAVWVKRHGPK